MQVIKDVISYWGETWREDKLVFFLELSGTLMGMTAATILNFLAMNPPMLVVFSLYTISAMFLTYTSFKRRASFMIILMLFYSIIGMVGIANLLFMGG